MYYQQAFMYFVGTYIKCLEFQYYRFPKMAANWYLQLQIKITSQCDIDIV